jgi:fructose-1,6-bisphosphatase/inositol monophosphatase family enzyme
MKPTLNDLERLARGAGAILRDGYNTEHQVSYKGLIDLVTETDHASEAYLIKRSNSFSRKPYHRRRKRRNKRG